MRKVTYNNYTVNPAGVKEKKMGKEKGFDI
jgi:hypothetical protein